MPEARTTHGHAHGGSIGNREKAHSRGAHTTDGHNDRHTTGHRPNQRTDGHRSNERPDTRSPFRLSNEQTTNSDGEQLAAPAARGRHSPRHPRGPLFSGGHHAYMVPRLSPASRGRYLLRRPPGALHHPLVRHHAHHRRRLLIMCYGFPCGWSCPSQSSAHI